MKRWVTAVLLGMLIGCGGRYDVFPETEEFLVAKGDTLYSIAWANEVDPDALARWNGLKPPYRLYPGQPLVLRAPFDEYPEQASAPPARTSQPPKPVSKPSPSKPVATAPTPAKPVPGKKPVATPKPPVVAKPAEPATVAVPAGSSSWRWPAAGAAKRANASGDTSRTGLQIFGKLGEPVRAARAGRVVYAGSGLQGYGLLAIIKHDETYLSAYGHNDRLLVREGDSLSAGQPLAEMGEGPGQQPLVYFEVRKRGKPIDPLAVLPKR